MYRFGYTANGAAEIGRATAGDTKEHTCQSQRNSASCADVAIAAAREAGAAIRAVAERGVREIVFKGEGKRDLVTEADKRSEQIIIDAITQALSRSSHPRGGGHEHGRRWRLTAGSLIRWMARRTSRTSYPLYCVSIAVEHAGEPVVGVVLRRTWMNSSSRSRAAGRR